MSGKTRDLPCQVAECAPIMTVVEEGEKREVEEEEYKELVGE